MMVRPLLLFSLFMSAQVSADELASHAACTSLLSYSGALQASPTQAEGNWSEAYLRLLSLVLEGIDEIADDAFGHGDRAQAKSLLLKKLSSSPAATNPLDETLTLNNSTRPAIEGHTLHRRAQPPSQDLTHYSSKLSTLAESGQFETITENLTDEDWKNIRQTLLQKAEEFQTLQTARDNAKPATQLDFEDLPDRDGNTRLLRLLYAQQYEQAYQLVTSSNINTRYINHLNLANQTALDIYHSNGIENTRLYHALRLKKAITKDYLYSLDNYFLKAAFENDCQRIRELHDLGLNFYWDNKEVFAYPTAHLAEEVRLIRKRNGLEVPAVTPLHKAIENNHIEAIKLLVKLGANVNAFDDQGHTPFSYAMNVMPDIPISTVETLLSDDFDLELKDRLSLFVNLTPFLWAVKSGREDIMKLLIARGANAKAHSTYGVNALDLLNSDYFKDIDNTLKWLISLGLDIDGQDNPKQDTPLHGAAQRGDLALVKALLAHGANPTVMNLLGHTPYDLAYWLYYKDTKKAIRAELKKYTPTLWSRLRAKLTHRGKP